MENLDHECILAAGQSYPDSRGVLEDGLREGVSTPLAGIWGASCKALN
jgi:hypothetical protein